MRLSHAIVGVSIVAFAAAAMSDTPLAHARTYAGAALVPLTPPHVDTTVRRSPFGRGPLDRAAARRLAGCYSVDVGVWSEPHFNGGRTVTPTEIRLDTVAVAHPSPGFALVVETPGFVNPSHFAEPPSWAPVKGDSLQATIIADGTSSVTVFAQRHAKGSFTAIARYFSDAIAVDPVTRRWLWETYPTAPVRLTAHACARGR